MAGGQLQLGMAGEEFAGAVGGEGDKETVLQTPPRDSMRVSHDAIGMDMAMHGHGEAWGTHAMGRRWEPKSSWG